jgi:tRNA threonylcarbamoyladenosine biosynthesis protein TsaB
MRVLAIETSGRHGSAAILEGGRDAARLVGQTTLGTSQRTAQALAPAINDLLVSAGWPAASIELVAVAVGPGSFTGLRIGVTTAKTFAYAVGAKVVAVSTLAVLASQVPPTGGPLWAVVDAQRQELFAAKFGCAASGRWEMVGQTSIVPQDRWFDQLAAGDQVTGPALRRLGDRLPSEVAAAPEEFWQPTAAAVGQLGWRAYGDGQRDDLLKLVPIYYRPSAAEEKAAKADKTKTQA